MNRLKTLTLITFCLAANVSFAQIAGEDAEMSPEELDAAFTAEDAAREAASWSDVILPRDNRAPLERMSDEADLVFHGTVESQSVVYDDNDVPFTHTTFSIRELVKGDSEATEITLVQEGGPDRTERDKILLVSTSKHFAQGEEELLFVKFSATTGTDIVQQRFPVLQNNVYDEDGHGIILEEAVDGHGPQLRVTGERNSDERFTRIKVGPHTLFKNVSVEDRNEGPNPEEASTPPTVRKSAGIVGSSVGDFIAAMTE